MNRFSYSEINGLFLNEILSEFYYSIKNRRTFGLHSLGRITQKTEFNLYVS